MSTGKIKQISIAGSPVGIIGLDHILEIIHSENPPSEDNLKQRLLDGVKKGNYVPTSLEKAYKKALFREYRRFLGESVDEEAEGLTIRVLGPGCPNCDKLFRDIQAVLVELNVRADLIHVTDTTEIAGHGVVPLPGLVINRKLVSSGRVPVKEKLREWIRDASPK
ncbi:thioredoxin family protein [candidate division KSB1 bacterium]|nr:thioredoxin family protein [candidate division KSB1 bacterium]